MLNVLQEQDHLKDSFWLKTCKEVTSKGQENSGNVLAVFNNESFHLFKSDGVNYVRCSTGIEMSILWTICDNSH